MYLEKRFEVETETPVKTLEPWRQNMLDAADLIEQRGHAKNILEDSNGSLCFVGALSMAVTGYSDAIDLRVGIGIQKMFPFIGQNPVDWNNAPERTKEEVVSAMRACARS